jgi:HPt (histidine-containing phosphotransfer) domain-containing protein
MTIADQPSHRLAPDADAAHGLLDAADGIARVMGDRALYERMLGRFCGDHAEGAAPIRRAIAAGDLRLAHRLVHTLKGASGLIGATAVYRQAVLLEAELRTACAPPSDLSCLPDLPGLLDSLDHALAAVVRAIGARLAYRAARGDAPARAPHPAPALLLAQLTDLLDRGDGAALDLLEQWECSLKAALGEHGFDAVARAAGEFDFEQALAALGLAKRETGGN